MIENKVIIRNTMMEFIGDKHVVREWEGMGMPIMEEVSSNTL
jgi:hypothetical protein